MMFFPFILVDRNTTILGCRVFGNNGSFSYKLQLYKFGNMPLALQVLNGTITANDCIDGIATLKFAKPIPIKVRY